MDLFLRDSSPRRRVARSSCIAPLSGAGGGPACRCDRGSSALGGLLGRRSSQPERIIARRRPRRPPRTTARVLASPGSTVGGPRARPPPEDHVQRGGTEAASRRMGTSTERPRRRGGRTSVSMSSRAPSAARRRVLSRNGWQPDARHCPRRPPRLGHERPGHARALSRRTARRGRARAAPRWQRRRRGLDPAEALRPHFRVRGPSRARFDAAWRLPASFGALEQSRDFPRPLSRPACWSSRCDEHAATDRLDVRGRGLASLKAFGDWPPW